MINTVAPGLYTSLHRSVFFDNRVSVEIRLHVPGHPAVHGSKVSLAARKATSVATANGAKQGSSGKQWEALGSKEHSSNGSEWRFLTILLESISFKLGAQPMQTSGHGQFDNKASKASSMPEEIVVSAWLPCANHIKLGKSMQISPCENPNSRGELQYRQTAPKMEPSIKSKSAEHKTKASFRTSIWSLETSGGSFKFQTFTSKYTVFFLTPLNLYVRPVSGTFMWNRLTLMWNLDLKPLCSTFTRNLYVKFFSGAFMTNLVLQTSRTWIILWSLSLWKLVRVEPFCGTWGNLTLYVEPELLRMEPLFGTLGNLNF